MNSLLAKDVLREGASLANSRSDESRDNGPRGTEYSTTPAAYSDVAHAKHLRRRDDELHVRTLLEQPIQEESIGR